ncbi:sulfite exporter TauE/SafE family protein [Legionella sp. CNM-1927-20]|uniref:sulfite exporter TauE/SafE family protein n=1 Tax=Legionella sp. CNM-1927-20 TaxID=3422221 RepID=UPI00403AA717
MLLITMIYLIVGVLTGILATMFGFGGGVLVVPLLFWILSFHHVPVEIVMHIAVGTSLAFILINMLYASWLHYLNQTLNAALLKLMLPPVALGAMAGALIASFISSFALRGLFIILLVLVFINTFKKEFFYKKNSIVSQEQEPNKTILYIISLITGVIASMLGIGGSVIIVPFFRYYNYSMQKASAVANGLAVPSSLIGSLVLAVAGYNLPNLPPYSTGYIYWPALFGLFLGSMLGSKIGIFFSGIVPDWLYGKIYAFLLLLVIFLMSIP